MQELSNAMTQASRKFEFEPTPEHERIVSPEGDEMRHAAKCWAAASLTTFDGELLRKSLAISAAMADFVNELERP